MSRYKALPGEALALCQSVSAPQRLVTHLTLVHDVATQLVARLHGAFPDLIFDEGDVFFGAATHDIGKAHHRQELSEPGKLHEAYGAESLVQLGIPPHRARFAFTHGNWNGETPIQIEDLLVALADNCWKGKRVHDLETKVVAEIVQKTQRAQWEVFAALDEILQELGADADRRLAWQGAPQA